MPRLRAMQLERDRSAEGPSGAEQQKLVLAFAADRDGELARLPVAELAGHVRATRELTAGLDSSMLAYREFYVARAWADRGQLDRVVSCLEGFRASYPDEAFGAQNRGELLAEAYRALGRAADALQELGRLEREMARSGPDDAAAASIHGIRGEVLLENGMVDEASREFDREWMFAKRSGDAQVVRNALLRRGEQCLSTGRFSDVHAVMQEFLASKQLSRMDRAEVVRPVAEVYLGVAEYGMENLDANRSRTAARSLSAALASEHLSPVLRLVAHTKLTEIGLRDGDLDAAARHLASAQELLETVDSLEREAMVCAMAVRLARLRPGADGDLERGRMGATGARLETAFAAYLAQWSKLGERRHGVGFLFHADRRVILGELLAATAEADGDNWDRALELLFRVQTVSTIAKSRGAAACTIADVRDALLPPGQGLLIYFPWKRCTLLFALERGGVEVAVLPSDAELTRPTHRLMDALALHPRAAAVDEQYGPRLLELSKRVARALLPARMLEKVLGWDGVTVVGSELLANVPFAALALDSGELLGEVLPVANLSSLPLGVQLRRSLQVPLPGSTSLRFLGCTDTHAEGVGSEFTPVPLPRQGALAELLNVYDVAETSIDRELTVEHLRGLDLRGAMVTHLLGHNVRDTTSGKGMGIALSDGVFWFDDFLAKKVEGLVVVSSCAAGRSAQRLGDGSLVTNIGGALMRRGAHTIVQSQAPIELSAHLEFMAVFHRELASGRSPAAALVMARGASTATSTAERFRRAQVQVHGLGHVPVTGG